MPGKDPLLAGTVVGNLLKCEQAQHLAGDIKHYVMNDQEAGRFFVNSVMSKWAMQESDLLSFHIAISWPVRQLKGFERVPLEPGENKTLTFPLGEGRTQGLESAN